jgi:hypothetical protein
VAAPVAPIDPINTSATDYEELMFGVLVDTLNRPNVPILTRLVPVAILGQ